MHHVDLSQFPGDIELAQAAAADWLQHLRAHGEEKPIYTLALSGGRIAKHFFTQVVQQVREKKISLSSVHFFWADERCVSAADPESNYATAKQLLFDPLQIPATRIHRIPGELHPHEAATRAEKELIALFGFDSHKTPALDLVLLGMGEDGHVASLFPGDDFERQNAAPLFRSVVATKPPPNRVTMTYRLLQAATEVWVLASGAGKATALSESLLSDRTPLGQVRLQRPSLRIFSDIRID